MRDAALVGWYDYRLVVLSIVVAVLGSYAGLELAGRARLGDYRRRGGWVAGAAVALAVGVWSMHYTAMLAYRLPVPVLYHWPTTLLSYLPALAGSLVGLFLITDRLDGPRAARASVFVGAGIVALHYVAMCSMRLPAEDRYSNALVALSVLPAVAFSFGSLAALRGGREGAAVHGSVPLAALLMGTAISAMHYTGMAAVTFVRSPRVPDLSHSVQVGALGIAGILGVSIFVLSVAPLASTLDRLQKKSEQLRALTARTHLVREEERKRVAREIHDELGQALTSIKLDVAALSRQLPPGQAARAEAVTNLVDETIRTVRRIATELRPGVLDDLGLAAAAQWAAEDFEARTGIACAVSVPDEEFDVAPEAATQLFRILQEALTNVTRHARARHVSIRLAGDVKGVVLEVRDDGIGADARRLAAGGSLGILGMQERAALLAGVLTVESAPEQGTVVRVRLPRSSAGTAA